MMSQGKEVVEYRNGDHPFVDSNPIPRCPMYGLFAYIRFMFMLHVGKYTTIERLGQNSNINPYSWVDLSTVFIDVTV